MGKDAPPAARNGASKSPVKGSGSPAATAAAAQAAAEKGLPTQNSVVPVAVAANLGLGLRPRPNARPPATGATTTGPPPAKAIGAGTVTRPKAPKAPPVRPDASAAKAAGAAPNSSSPPPRSGTGTVARPRAPSQGDEAKTSRDGGTAARDGAPGERAGATAPSKSSTGERASAAATTAPVKSSTGERAGAAAPSKSSTGERASAAATTAPVKSSTGERAGATAPSKSSTGERASAATAAPVKSSTGTGVNRSSASPSGGAASTGKSGGEPLGSSAVETSQTSSPSPAKAAGTAPAAKAPASTATVSNLPGRPGAPPPAGMLAILGGMSDFLSSVSNQATGGYSEEQRRGCIACALRLGKPELVNVLARLHSLAASCWSHSSSDSSAVKALAVLLGVSLAANKDSLEEAIAWRLARPPANAWRREHRLTALALLLKAPPKADSEAELVVKLLKSVVSMATAALCALLSASAGTTLDDAKQGAVLKLAEQVASGSVGKGKTYPGLEILALLLGCDAKEAAILSHASNVAWAKTAQSAIKTVAIGFEMAETAKPNSNSQATTTPSTATAPVAAPVPVAVAATGSPDAGKEVEAAPPKPVETKKAKDEDMESEKPDGWNALKALVEEADEEDEDEALEENDEEEDEEESVDAAHLLAAGEYSDSDEVGSYAGSDLDGLLGVASDSEMESLEMSDKEGEPMKEETTGGLLTAMFRGGSLHSEEKMKDRGRRVMIVEYPNMIWKGQEICVLQKPADWICSASDVDKKKGRKLDPNEDLRNKGFKIMKDLMDYKFAEREKKYIHWWIQLTHDTNREEYPNLFDVDQNYGLCHRLDRETSGTVLVGITKKSRTQMRECFHRHYVRKLYVCLVHGFIDKAEQTVDRNLEAMGQKAKLDRRGKRARTHVKVLGYFTRTHKSGRVDEFTLCTCEIAEGRMHQIRLHMAAALGSPIVSEFYYQKAKQMIEDRRWCQRVFLHAYAVGFPDMGAVNDDDEDEEGDCEEDDEEKLRVEDTEQEWHCCICPLTNELRKVMKDLKPRKEQLKGVQAETMLQSCLDSGLISPSHKEVHCKGTQQRGQLIDDVFFPWSSKVNPIQVGDLAKVRADASQRQKQQALIQQQHEERLEKQKSRRSFSRDAPREGREGQGTVALRPKAKARGRDSISPRRKRGVSMGSKRPRVGRGRLRSPGPPPPPAKDRSAEPSLSPSDDVKNPPVNRQVTRGRVRSRSGRVIRRRSQSIRRRLPGPPAPPSPPCRRSSSVIQRRGKRRKRDAPMSPDRPEPDKRGVRSQLGGRRRGGALSQG